MRRRETSDSVILTDILNPHASPTPTKLYRTVVTPQGTSQEIDFYLPAYISNLKYSRQYSTHIAWISSSWYPATTPRTSTESYSIQSHAFPARYKALDTGKLCLKSILL
jgi:hypothetical protein